MGRGAARWCAARAAPAPLHRAMVRWCDGAHCPTRNPSRPQSLEQLEQRLEGVERPMVQLMLDTLVSRRLLRSFVLNGVLYWQRG